MRAGVTGSLVIPVCVVNIKTEKEGYFLQTYVDVPLETNR